jgi:hypothetical protein
VKPNVRLEWLKALPAEYRKIIGDDLKTAQ